MRRYHELVAGESGITASLEIPSGTEIKCPNPECLWQLGSKIGGERCSMWGETLLITKPVRIVVFPAIDSPSQTPPAADANPAPTTLSTQPIENS